jgi:hypothetical protein
MGLTLISQKREKAPENYRYLAALIQTVDDGLLSTSDSGVGDQGG